MIKAGQDDNKKLEYKKKLVEIASIKKFDRAKLLRLLNFVEKLVTLPPNLQNLFTNFISKPQIQGNMQLDKGFLDTFRPLFEEALKEETKEAREQGLEQGLEQGIEKTILAIHHKMGFNAEQIANMTNYEVEYIQSVLDKFYKNNSK